MGNNDPGLVFLPDEAGAIELESGIGAVQALHAADFVRDAADAMAGTPGRLPDVMAVRAALQHSLEQGDTGHWRGMLAAALLADAWEEDCGLRVAALWPDSSPLAAAVLRCAQLNYLGLLLLQRGERQALLGLVDPQYGVIPAADPQQLNGLLPPQISWYDPETNRFLSPIDALSQSDRLLLIERLSSLSLCQAAPVQPYADFLADLRQAEAAQSPTALPEAAARRWQKLLRAVIGMSGESLASLSVEDHAHRPALHNALLTALGGTEPVDPQPVTALWRWNGIAFARSHSRLGLEPLLGEEAEQAGETLCQAEQLLQRHSQRYRRELPARIAAFCGARSWAEETGRQFREWERVAQAEAAIAPEPLELNCPDETSGEITRLLLQELLGEELAALALRPFSDRLCLMPQADCGDAMLNQRLRVDAQGRPCVALLPLSDRLAEYTAMHGAALGVQPDETRITPGAFGMVDVSLLLRGTGQARLHHAFTLEEQVVPLSVPDFGLWPAVPLPPERWHVWYISQLGDFSVRALDSRGWVEFQGSASDSPAVHTVDRFPHCIGVARDGCSMGALLCRAVPCTPPQCGAAVASLDLGTSGLSMAARVAGQVQQAVIPPLWRPLLRSAAAPPREQPLPTDPLGPVLPACVQHMSAIDPEPFVHGSVCPERSLTDAAPYAGLLWRMDSQGIACRMLLQRQAALLLSLHCVMHGAQSIHWRFVLPEGLEAEEEERMLRELRETALWADVRTGLHQLPEDSGEPVRSGIAQSAWLRALRPSESALAVLDIGASSSYLALWLYGLDRPAASCSLPAGSAAMLAPWLSRRPSALQADFSGSGVPGVDALHGALTGAGSDSVSALWHGVDTVFGRCLQQSMAWMYRRLNTGEMPASFALLLLGWAERFALVGIMLEQAHRDSTLNDRLPPALSLWLCGRGTSAIGMLDEGTRRQLMRFLRIGMDGYHPVRSIRLAMSPAPRMEAVYGAVSAETLPQGHTVPAPFRGELPQFCVNFLLLFRAAFPSACELLFPGCFSESGVLTQQAWETLSALTAGAGADLSTAFLSTLEALCLPPVDAGSAT